MKNGKNVINNEQKGNGKRENRNKQRAKTKEQRATTNEQRVTSKMFYLFLNDHSFTSNMYYQ